MWFKIKTNSTAGLNVEARRREKRLTNTASCSINVANQEVGSVCVELKDISVAGTQGLREGSGILYFLASNRLGRTNRRNKWRIGLCALWLGSEKDTHLPIPIHPSASSFVSLHTLSRLQSRDTVDGVVTEKSFFDSRQEAGAGDFCFLHTARTGPGTLWASYSFGTGGSFQWRTEGGLGCSNPPPRNSEDIGGVLDRMSKKNRRLDFFL